MSDLQIGIIFAAVGTVLSVIAAVTIPLSRGIWERFFRQFRSTAVPGMVKDKPTVKERFIFALEMLSAAFGFGQNKMVIFRHDILRQHRDTRRA